MGFFKNIIASEQHSEKTREINKHELNLNFTTK